MGNSKYELVETGTMLPFDVSLHSVNYVPSHWHNSVEIIFVLRGKLEVTVGAEKSTLSEGDVLVINSWHVHEVIGRDLNIIATYQIPLSFLKTYISGVEQIQFDCHSSQLGPNKREAMDRMRQLLAEMVQLIHKKGESYELDMQVRMLGILSILMKQFKAEAASAAMNEKYMERMMRIITFIDEHYREPVSLLDLAEREFLSVPYLSKFFSENIGLNFQSYLTNIRLKNTVEALLHHVETPIADLAMQHGFPNAKSFYAAFKNRYELTPTEYRKQYRPDIYEQKEKWSSNYLAFNQSSALGIINQYLQRGQSFSQAPVQPLHSVTHQVDMETIGKPIKHTWKTVITIGKAKEGLHADVQRELRNLQRRCPFSNIRFHGIFDDAMMLYDEDEAGEPRYNFRFVDQLFDFLLSIGLKPFVELGFMPSKLAADPSQTVFSKASYTSPPKSLNRWCEMVRHFVRHCMNRYGAPEVESWKFEFWNEPEFPAFWPATEAEYMQMYKRTFQTIKSISARLQIGAPGRIITFGSFAFSEAFFAFCKQNDCLPDFIPLHFYPHEHIDDMMDDWQNKLMQLAPYRQLQDHFRRISPNPNYLKEKLIHEVGFLKEQGLADREVYLTEWNSTAYHRELTNDTLYKAAYIVKNLVENLDDIQGFGYWVLSDNIEETVASPRLFHGGLGLVAQHGVPKAAQYAYDLLAKLGDRLIAREEGYIVTASSGGYQVLAYNYCHFDDLYALGDTSFIDETNRYNGFKDEKVLKMAFELKAIANGKYRMITHRINRKHGSSYDKWVEMGAPEPLSAEDIEYIKTASVPERSVQTVEAEHGFTFDTVLEPHAVALIELIPLY
ncbi:GH39 family glycosyl hydrolase [Paenibacillus sp. LPE1-1-1.1]|uniref:GH39 family glycosyl hydrolase n=1 Tax=Paenibacillus sp. LPE1-1-1.1 TaxID=3135230 RepID=UPI00341236DB